MIPPALAAAPRLSRWITINASGTVAVRSGKVELGQGILTALGQIVADELDVGFNRIQLIPLTAPVTAEQTLTAGSRSLEESGAALRQAAAEVRALFIAASGLGSHATVHDGLIMSDAGTTSYWDLAETVSLDVDATGEPRPKPPSHHTVVGTSTPRIDLPDKVYGRARFIHDMSLPGMLYGRVVRPPSPGATLRSLDTSATKALTGIVEVVRDGSFLGVVAAQEETAISGAELLRSHAVWDETASLPSSVAELLTSTPVETQTVDAVSPGFPTTATAYYSRPYLAHASIGPACAIAQWSGTALEVWSHTQGAYNLRKAITIALPVALDQITVHHVEGSGCYGHNGADDVAFDAVLLARVVPGHAVQVVWSRADELAWAPFGPAMGVRMSACVENGTITGWRHETFGNGHLARPGMSPTAPGLLSAAYLADAKPLFVSDDPPTARGGGAQRNAIPLYTFPRREIIKNRLLHMPLRTSAMRALGAYLNVFAIESFMDELAGDVDPVEFRLRHLTDDRARTVILAAADRAGWWDRVPEQDRGCGFGFARYSNHGAYCAVVAEVRAEQELQVTRLTVAVDAGLVVSPDGLRNQIEGGAIQSTSWTLKEEVRFTRTRVTSTDWESYPILKFSEVPDVDVLLVNRPDLPSRGAGEAAQGPTAAAIGNALADALGVRVRTLPLNAENIIAAMPG
ncbi:xanthine dehydrogenase family protein molybdopterin-binding subunit [Kibdelosporangium persicum]|uniref:Nicotinate dehydrogenase subunit B n=1 Tax=Kibdelosporangium persicum TaxID=2698649 RepID=A0ABX2F769_9PSEU|nr:molybdopterin cofactor-binding domain-containing protein [Kibdelosporangium persicum]NRN66645.1 Nicotinate dehydrogenase subunit B [Kibdelosporangium persicum]